MSQNQKPNPISTPELVVRAAQDRAESGTSGDAARASYRTLLRGDATAADRKAAVVAALRQAGLVRGGFTPSPSRFVVVGENEEMVEREWAKDLTPQRIEVLTAFYDGLSYTETAEATHRSVGTVKAHAENLYRLFGVTSKVECVMEAVRAGVLPPPPAKRG
jgi:DNA-binding NarL/FixJ family response regulator